MGASDCLSAGSIVEEEDGLRAIQVQPSSLVAMRRQKERQSNSYTFTSLSIDTTGETLVLLDPLLYVYVCYPCTCT